MLDYLIEKGENSKSDMEYLYLLDMVWEKDSLGHIDIKYGTIVHNVRPVIRNEQHCGYEFNIGDSLICYRSNYPWAFAENTEENRKRIEKYHKKLKTFKKIEKECDILRNEIVTLKIKKEN